ncbi:MAG: porin [Rubrivivax sp.]|jgi:predicted porin|nr:porin [Rubrivivax sp.]
MKKPFIVLALAAAAATSAQAQSTAVTLFGIVDASLRQVKNGGDSVSSLASGGINSSRLGVRGAEDLGGGLRAGFWLEHGFNLDTGTQSDASRFWNRRSTVSLIGGFGEVRLGRDFTPIYTGWSDFDAFSDNGVAAGGKFSDRIGSNVDTLTRSDNQLTYLLPAMGGVYGQLSVAAGEGAAGRKMIAGRVGYSAGPLNVSVALGRTEVTPTAGSDEHEVITLGGSYDLGVMRVLAYWRQNEFGAGKVTVTSIGATVPLRSGTFRASFTRADGSGRTPAGTLIGDNDADQFALGYVHNLSKRSALYATYARVANDGRATYATGTPPALAAGATSTGYEFGVRHSF